MNTPPNPLLLSLLAPAPTYQMGTTSTPSADASPSHKEISHAGEQLPLPTNVSVLATGNNNNFTSRPIADTASEDSGSPPKSVLRHLSKVYSDWSLLYEHNSDTCHLLSCLQRHAYKKVIFNNFSFRCSRNLAVLLQLCCTANDLTCKFANA